MPSIMDRVRAGVRAATNQRQREQLKNARSLVRRMQRAFAPPVTAHTLARDLRRAGIAEGDAVMVHSSLSSMKNVEGGAETVIRALLDVVTPRGTILMPAFCPAEEAFERSHRGDPVDLRTLGTVNGKITSVFAAMPGVARSSHPFSSICAIGAQAQWLVDAHDTAPKISHRESPLGRLLQLNGKSLGIGTTMATVSFYHVLEDTWDGYPFDPYLEPEPVTYIDALGRPVTRPVARYDRERTKVRIDNDLGLAVREFMMQHMRARRIRHDFSLGGAPAFWLPVRALYEELQALAQEGVTIYSTAEEVRNFERRSNDSSGPSLRPRTESGRGVQLRS